MIFEILVWIIIRIIIKIWFKVRIEFHEINAKLLRDTEKLNWQYLLMQPFLRVNWSMLRLLNTDEDKLSRISPNKHHLITNSVLKIYTEQKFIKQQNFLFHNTIWNEFYDYYVRKKVAVLFVLALATNCNFMFYSENFSLQLTQLFCA